MEPRSRCSTPTLTYRFWWTGTPRADPSSKPGRGWSMQGCRPVGPRMVALRRWPVKICPTTLWESGEPRLRGLTPKEIQCKCLIPIKPVHVRYQDLPQDPPPPLPPEPPPDVIEDQPPEPKPKKQPPKSPPPPPEPVPPKKVPPPLKETPPTPEPTSEFFEVRIVGGGSGGLRIAGGITVMIEVALLKTLPLKDPFSDTEPFRRVRAKVARFVFAGAGPAMSISKGGKAINVIKPSKWHKMVTPRPVTLSEFAGPGNVWSHNVPVAKKLISILSMFHLTFAHGGTVNIPDADTIATELGAGLYPGYWTETLMRRVCGACQSLNLGSLRQCLVCCHPLSPQSVERIAVECVSCRKEDDSRIWLHQLPLWYALGSHPRMPQLRKKPPALNEAPARAVELCRVSLLPTSWVWTSGPTLPVSLCIRATGHGFWPATREAMDEMRGSTNLPPTTGSRLAWWPFPPATD